MDDIERLLGEAPNLPLHVLTSNFKINPMMLTVENTLRLARLRPDRPSLLQPGVAGFAGAAEKASSEGELAAAHHKMADRWRQISSPMWAEWSIVSSVVSHLSVVVTKHISLLLLEPEEKITAEEIAVKRGTCDSPSGPEAADHRYLQPQGRPAGNGDVERV